MSTSRNQLRAILAFAYGLVPAFILLFGLSLFNEELLVRIGNSGLTERPHLHLQACSSADGDH